MNEHVKIGRPIEIGEAQTSLPELVAAASRGEEVILSEAGVPQARIVPLGTRTIEQIIAAEKAMTPKEIEERRARRRAAFGMFKHLVKEPVPGIEPCMTDEELEERWNRKFGPAA